MMDTPGDDEKPDPLDDEEENGEDENEDEEDEGEDEPEPEEVGAAPQLEPPTHRRRGWPRGRARRRLTEYEKLSKEFQGISKVGMRISCCESCHKGYCYITRTDICGHPNNGANQFPNNAGVCERRARAQRYLDYQKVEAR
jgi:hypothetical protein